MALRLHIFEYVNKLAVGADEKCRAGDTGYGLTVHCLISKKIEVLDECLVCISEERVLYVVLVGKLLLRLDCVTRDAKDDGAGLLQLGKLIAKAASFDGATWRVGTRVEEKNDGRALELRERDGITVLIGEGEILNEVARFWCHVERIARLRGRRRCGQKKEATQ